jgi:hypothetical protein
MKESDTNCKLEHKKYPETPKRILEKMAGVAARATGVNLAFEKYRETRDEEWPKMTTKQKLGAVAATAVSFGRLVREGVKFGKPDSERGWIDTIGDVIFAASDGLDGMIARGTGGKTAFGGFADQFLGDKVPRWIKEISMASRGRLSAAHVIIRIGRDLYVTYQRDKITEETGGAISVDASPKSDLFSGKYSTVNYLFVNALLDSPLGKEIPGWAREALATVTDSHLVATGIASVKRLKDNQRRLAREKLKQENLKFNKMPRSSKTAAS